MVKNLIFEPNFQHGSQFLDFAKFHLLHVQSGQNSIIMFKFEWKGGIKMSKFKDNLGIDQSVTGELIKMLKFEWNMGNRTILVQNVKSIRMLKFGCKGGIHQSTEIKFKFWNQSKCWSLSTYTIRWVDQNVKVWVKSGELIKMLKFEDKVGNQP